MPIRQALYRSGLILSISILAAPNVASSHDAGGRWYLTGDNGARLVLSVDDDDDDLSAVIADEGQPDDQVDSIQWTAGTGTLQFRRIGDGQSEWYRLRIVDGVLKGRSTPPSANANLPAPTAFTHHVTGWNRDVIDAELTPRVFDAVLNERFLARIRIDRAPSDPGAFIGEMKVYATDDEGAIGEELLFDLQSIEWDGSTLAFQRASGDVWQTFQGEADDRSIQGTFTQSGSPQVFSWSGSRAEVLGRGLSPMTGSSLADWQSRTRDRLALMKMDGDPEPLDVTVNVLQSDLPPRSDATMPPRRDDNPEAWPQAYTLDELELLIDLPNRHGADTLTRRAHGYLSRPDGAPGEPRPVALVLNGHGGSASGMMHPNNAYWYGESFARRGYIVLALDVSHRSHGDDPDNGNIAHPAIASPGYSTDWEEEGERVWTAMRAIDYLLDLPGADPSKLVVAGLSMGGEVASIVAAMDPRVHTLVSAGYSPDFNVMAWNANHPCWEWKHADIREYVDMSDYLSLVSPRRAIVQSGQIDYTFSLRQPPFSADKQVVRRALSAWSMPSRPLHYLHDEGHVLRVGDIAVDGVPASGVSTTTVQSPAAPWDLQWQVDASSSVVAPDLFTLIGFGVDIIFADGFDLPDD
jgi:hypothetical protein